MLVLISTSFFPFPFCVESRRGSDEADALCGYLATTTI